MNSVINYGRNNDGGGEIIVTVLLSVSLVNTDFAAIQCPQPPF